MPVSFNHDGVPVMVSLTDVFKGSKALREERDALVRKRAELAEKHGKVAKALPPASQGKKTEKKVESDKKKVLTVPPKPNSLSHPLGPVPARHNSSWTDADDATLLRMVASNFEWPTIAIALARQVDEVEFRWNQIRLDRKEDRKKAGEQSDKSGAKVCDIDFHWSGNSANKSSSEKTNGLDNNLTLEDIVLLNTLAAKYEEDKWLRISSRFYDKTGKRISPQEAKKHVEQGQA